jgi:hypothetical protein
VQSYRSFLQRELAELAVIAETLNYGKEAENTSAAPKKRARRSEPAPLPPEPPLVPPTVAAQLPTIDPLPPFQGELPEVDAFEGLEPLEPFEPEPLEPEPFEADAESQSEIEFGLIEPTNAHNEPDDDDRGGESDGWGFDLIRGEG